MRRVKLPGIDIETSRIGFGCASLGSRVSARQGLRALARAHDSDVTWFDLAPAYGAGEAETIFADFLSVRRDIHVLTKVGLAPPARSPLLRAAYTVLRPLATLRKPGAPGVTRNRPLPITPALIEGSIATSLKRLRSDHVAVLALHDPDPEAVARDDVVRALERVLERGQARAVGVAGSADACLAGAAPDLPYRLFQTAWDSTGASFASIRREADRSVTTIAHSVLRGAGNGSRNLRAALDGNPHGVTLLSMFDANHLADNLAVEREADGSRPASEGMRASVEAAL